MSKSSESKAKKSEKKKADKKPQRVTGQNAGPQGFLPEHGEKLGFGLFALVVLLCIWGALGHQPYDKTPDQLAGTLQQKKTAVQQNKPEGSPLLEKLEVRDFSKQAPKSVEEVALVYRTPPPGDYNPYHPYTLKRGDPEVYPASDGKTTYLFIPVVWELEAKKASAKAKAKAPPPAEKKAPDPFLLQGTGDPKAKPKKGKEKEKPVGVVAPSMDLGPKLAAPVRGVQVPPDTNYQGQRLVMVTLRVPRANQAEAYRRAFAFARDYQPNPSSSGPGRDNPNYVSFVIERKTDGGEWESAVTIETAGGRKTMTFQEAYWEVRKHFPAAFAYPEIVDTTQEDCIVPFAMVENPKPDGRPLMPEGFTGDLPPILAEDFDERAAGGFPVKQTAAAPGAVGVPGGAAPGVPVPGAGAPAGPGAAPGVAPPAGLAPQPGGAIPRAQKRGKGKYPGVGPDGSFGGAGGNKGGPGGGAFSGGPGGRMIGGRPASEAGSGAGPRTTGNSGGPGGMMIGGRPASEVGSGMGPRTTGNAGQGGGPVNPFVKNQNQNQNQNVGAGMAQVQVAQLSDILLRFFDVTVEEGHTYQYRVQIVLKNPNHNLAVGVLKDIKFAKEEFLFTPWSEPTEPVRVTIGGSEVVAGPVRETRERVGSGVADSAMVILRQRDRAKAHLLAHTFQKLEAGQALNFQVKEFKELKFEKPVGGVDALPQFDFHSDNLILDLRGGGDRGWPGEMLLLDAGGRLVVQSEIGKSNPSFAAESSRLETIYSRQAPAAAEAAGFGAPAFDFGGGQPAAPKKK